MKCIVFTVCEHEYMNMDPLNYRAGYAAGIFIYSGFARLTSFEINFISKETSQAELE